MPTGGRVQGSQGARGEGSKGARGEGSKGARGEGSKGARGEGSKGARVHTYIYKCILCISTNKITNNSICNLYVTIYNIICK